MFAASVTLPGGPVAAQTPIDTGTPVRGGARLTAPLAGIEFTIPDGLAGRWDAEADGLVLEDERGLIVGLWGWSEGEVTEVGGALGARLETLGLRLSPRGEIREDERALTGLFDAWSSEGRGLLAAAIRRGPEGNVFALAVLGPAEDEATSIRDPILESLEFSSPGAAGWRGEVGDPSSPGPPADRT